MKWQKIDTVPRNEVIDLWHKDGFRIMENWWVEEDKCWSGTWEDKDLLYWIKVPDPISGET